MKYKIVGLLLIAIFTFGNVFTQDLSKSGKKSLKKELKKMLKDPVKYKLMKESITTKETIINDQTKELIALDRENSMNKNRLEFARDSLTLCLLELENLKEKSNNGGVDDSGMKFKLQIGLYKEFDITNFFEQTKLVSFEKDDYGNFVYSIGNFDTEYDAELFKSAIREMGIKDAFVAYYLDGKRISKD